MEPKNCALGFITYFFEVFFAVVDFLAVVDLAVVFLAAVVDFFAAGFFAVVLAGADLMTACAPARRAAGTRYGEKET